MLEALMTNNVRMGFGDCEKFGDIYGLLLPINPAVAGYCCEQYGQSGNKIFF